MLNAQMGYNQNFSIDDSDLMTQQHQYNRMMTMQNPHHHSHPQQSQMSYNNMYSQNSNPNSMHQQYNSNTNFNGYSQQFHQQLLDASGQ